MKKTSKIFIVIGISIMVLVLIETMIWISLAPSDFNPHTHKVPNYIGWPAYASMWITLIGGILLAICHKNEIISEIKNLLK